MKSVRQGKRAGGFTIVEVLSALVILSIVGTAVCGLTMAAMNSDRFLRSANTAQMEVEWAMRRIANNIREAQTGTITAGSNTLSMTTQADSTHGYPNGATVSYSLGADPTISTQNDLYENDQRFGNNILVQNVKGGGFSTVSGYTNLYQVDLVTGTNPPVERHLQVFGRN